jgi:hypothetical protein
MRIAFLLLLLAATLCSCSAKSEKKYVVIDSFFQVAFETNDKKQAFDKAEKMTLLGRVLASKPQYFVIESEK